MLKRDFRFNTSFFASGVAGMAFSVPTDWLSFARHISLAVERYMFRVPKDGLSGRERRSFAGERYMFRKRKMKSEERKELYVADLQ